MTTLLHISRMLTIPADELSVAFVHASGSGGQNVNKVATKVELRWNLRTSRALTDEVRTHLQSRLAARLTTSGELIVTSQKTRSQHRNREDAENKMRAILVDAMRVDKARKATRPSKAVHKRRLDDKRTLGAKKRDRTSHWDNDS